MPSATRDSMLEEAITIAVEAHRGPRDKAGAPYILHPLRMMGGLQTEDEKIVAVLHDVVEDSDWTLDRLQARGFSPPVLRAVDALTRRPGESYEAFIDRAKADSVARRVKIADLEDNMDIRRIGEVTEKDAARLTKYHRSWVSLTRQAPVSGPEDG